MAEWIFLIILVGVVFYLIAVYNQLVSYRNRFRNGYAQIDVQLTRRHDLIPNLVNTAKGYMEHERNTLEAVISARNRAEQATQRAADHPADAAAIRGVAEAESILTGALGKFFALAEDYPDLKADRTMQQLMEELTSTENKVSFARQAYNDAVMQYNTYREQFPHNMVAGPLSFHEAELFKLETDAARQAPEVKF